MKNLERVQLYRAVERAELADLRLRKEFAASPNGTLYKGFFFSREDAERFQKQQAATGGPETTIVRASAPVAVIKRSPVHRAAVEGLGVLIPSEELLWVTHHD